ncbi:hypothetical protein [Methylocystis heyeri]|uniref:Membrane-anchored protein n=1 Tax=Methylocystis heyeri TaxID=391905 RepID=A0A6B8KG81_9HYPH|nr:hypothetical protein [Methylocystis heyeri]QGM47394.1 hypothetical protein H2LOC_017820 [Methylocystis heyeri]
MNQTKAALCKAPEVTLGFWLIKILATTLGETGGDAATMSLDLGYAVGTLVFFSAFAVLVAAQIKSVAFNPSLYWATIVATTTVGTTMADYADRSLGIGYFGGSSILFLMLMASLAAWRWSEGAVAVNSFSSPRAEAFYWMTILLSQTLGTALGDWVADANEMGFLNGALLFGAGLAGVAAAYAFTKISHVPLFWAAFILTRPLGATLGDFLDKPAAQGGLEFSRYQATAILAIAMVVLIVVLPQRAGRHPASGAQKI